MARVQTPPILTQIRAARSYAEQIVAIRALKNEIVGHVQRQQRCVESGALETLVQVLERRRSPAKPNGKEPTRHQTTLKPLSEDESVRLQVIQLLASFANGGPPFLSPLHSARAVPALLANLCPIDNHPRIVLATLRALMAFTETATFALPPCPVEPALIADEVFVPAHLDSLCRVLVEPALFPTVSTDLVNAVARLIGCLCREERHQLALANVGILDALATKLAGFVVSRGQVVPGADFVAQNEGISEFMPQPAPIGTSLLAVLDAISAIIGDSRLRACILLYSPSILAVFPSIAFAPPAKDLRAAWDAMEAVGLGSTRPQNLGAMDYLLPIVPGQPKSSPPQISAFPPIGTAPRDNSAGTRSSRPQTNLSGWDSSRLEPSTSDPDSGAEDPEVPLIPWLIYVMRSSHGMESLAAASVLTSLFRPGFAGRSREAVMGALVIPPLMVLLGEKHPDTAAGTAGSQQLLATSSWVDPETATRWAIVERALAVLARLTTDNELLQKAAFECNAVKTISKFLKDTYEPLSTQDAPKIWNPLRIEEERGRLEAVASGYGLGPAGMLPLQRHRIRVRESALKVVASLMSFKEDYRKAFVEQDIVPFIVESLLESPSKPSISKERSSSNRPSNSRPSEDVAGSAEAASAYGRNSNPVLIAACHAIRMLARSTFIIRTTLQDAGIAQPLFRLTRHADVQVQIAATGVVCNLVIDFSPTREQLMDLGILKVLCEHAHSMNAALRLNAVWSLKHFVNGLSTDLKKACVEELQPGWLMQLICDDTEDDALFARTRMEKQSSTNPPNFDADEDVEMDQLEEDGGSKTAWPSSSIYGAVSPRLSHERSRTGRLRQAESKIAALREVELNPVRKARNDDLAIQEQALHFIRNLLTTSSSGGNPEAEKDGTEMVDYLFSVLGQDRLFEILAAKLRVKHLHTANRRFSGGGIGSGSGNAGAGNAAINISSGSVLGSSTNASRTLYPQPKIIEPVVYILVHVAASEARHRQLVIAQTDLLKALGTHFNSRDKEVRVALCHLVVNLTWRDNSADTMASERRADELRRLGMLAKLESLQQDDSELDVRERAKIAIYQIKRGGNGSGGIGGSSGNHH